MKKLIIIPAYNEELNIASTVQRAHELSPDYDVIVINDASLDHTREVCENNNIPHLNLPINLGIGGAVQTGYRFASRHGYDIAVQVDADGQHNPEFLKEMENKLAEEDADMIIGSRFLENEGFQSSFMRRIGINYFSGLIRILTGQRITDPTSGLRMVGKRAIKLFSQDYPSDYPEPETDVQLVARGYKVIEIPVIMNERQGGESSINARKSVYYMIKVTLAIFVEVSRGKGFIWKRQD
ncbi:MAG: glycosyltransferase family 2 protein [Pseudobutyrivibrio ruminis]|uniref:glycosyltransferase family 2 protein n=1 Tax=Pseudobutyrivibrio ruminis TaxID=46206 RepID=UPI0026E9CAB2|nr:glycosyltransferase family 2 protein [Pseudobutyrivibrio ruminis]MBE5912928.1 glycosyltransferase family 2 protein [Pseudobutyrivibrio ruminis]